MTKPLPLPLYVADNAKYMRNRYADRRAKGICTRCPERAETGKSQCRACLDKAKAKSKRAYQERLILEQLLP